MDTFLFAARHTLWTPAACRRLFLTLPAAVLCLQEVLASRQTRVRTRETVGQHAVFRPRDARRQRLLVSHVCNSQHAGHNTDCPTRQGCCAAPCHLCCTSQQHVIVWFTQTLHFLLRRFQNGKLAVDEMGIWVQGPVSRHVSSQVPPHVLVTDFTDLSITTLFECGASK